MAQIRPTKIDLQEKIRKKVIQFLNENLVDAIHLAVQAKQAHWNVKGPAFFQYHELFDKFYGEASEWSDLIAERVAQMGGVAEANLESISRRTRLPSYRMDLVDGLEHCEALSLSLAVFCKNVRRSIDASESVGDAGTADLFTEISRAADKMLWFLESHLVKSKASKK